VSTSRPSKSNRSPWIATLSVFLTDSPHGWGVIAKCPEVADVQGEIPSAFGICRLLHQRVLRRLGIYWTPPRLF
jgi:hypothetical protein